MTPKFLPMRRGQGATRLHVPDCPIWLVATLLLAAHGLVPFTAGDMAPLASLACLVAMALLCALACMGRGRDSGVRGWSMMALALVLWAGGMVANAMMHLSLGHYQGDASVCLLFFVLYGVPLVFATSSPEDERKAVRLIDGALASALGLLFFVHTFTLSTLAGANAEDAERLTRMFDIENGLVALFALLRLVTSRNREKRDFFRILAVYGFVYMLCTAYMDHQQMEADYGTPVDLVIDMPFLLLLGLLSRPISGPAQNQRVPAWRERFAQAISPLLLPLMLLVVSATLLEAHSTWAITGFALATMVYGLRNALTHMRNLDERDRLEQLSQIDELTRLPNRRSFDASLQREWARARRQGLCLSVLMIDIDHFKLLNDHLGHLEGDLRLRQVANALAACRWREGDLVARYGGEEFVVILPGTDAQEAGRLAETIRASISDLALPSPAPGGRVSISIGVSTAGAVCSGNEQTLLLRADMALYEAKRGGRNAVRTLLAA